MISLMRIKVNFGIFAIAYLFLQPLYLLLANIPLICKKTLSYISSTMYMISAILFNVLYTIIIHKVKTGYFIGDVPGGVYFLMLCIPTVIILFGIGIVYLLKK